jgi:hypothetical protein
MVKAMKPGSVVVDLAAEKGGNCDLTKPDEKVVSDNGVTIVGYTDFPSRMATQSSLLYATNVRHMLTDLTPEKDGAVVHNMEDDVIRGATVTHQGEVTFPPPPPKVKAIAAAKPKEKVKEPTHEEKKAAELATFKAQTKRQATLLGVGGVLMLLLGQVAPAANQKRTELLGDTRARNAGARVNFAFAGDVDHHREEALRLASLCQIGATDAAQYDIAADLFTIQVEEGYAFVRVKRQLG